MRPQVARTSDPTRQVPERKQTSLELYVTAREAYEMWQADPDRVRILDVRTPEEYIFVGHVAMAKNIPILFVTHQWNAEKAEPAVEPNPDFIASAKSAFGTTDTLLVMSRSGGRGALAVNALAQVGFINAYNVVDGFEGDKVYDPNSAYHGKRMKNGWKNSGAPWTYDGNPALLWLTET